MRKDLFYLFIICSALFSACENEIPFHGGTQKPQLLMRAFLEANKESNIVNLDIIDGEKIRPVANGSVTVFVNGEKREEAKVETISWSWMDTIRYCTLKTVFQPGDFIRLEAVAQDDKYQAYAEVKIPLPMENIIQVDTFRTRLKIGYGIDDCMRYKITIKDRPGEKNYYRLIIQENEYYKDPVTQNQYGPSISYPDIISQEDVVLTDGHLTTADDENFGILDMVIQNKYNIFTDHRFLDATYTMKVYTRYSYYMSETKGLIIDAEIRLLSLPEAYYRYLRAMNCLESENYNATFMEPVIIPNNIHGGLGFVGAASETKTTVRIVDRPPLSPQ